MSDRTIGPYVVEGLLGEGGIGRVYAAHDKVLGRKVALKTLRPELSRDRNFIDRFYVEAKSLGTLNHSNITTIHAFHVEGDEAFMVMELVYGQTLEALLARVQRLSLRDSLAVLSQAIPGIRYAHRRGVIHRDLKPANLMLTEDGVVKIMDFGIARVQGSQNLTRVGEFCGTFTYASPEQIRGENVDERSDLYSLAILLYRLLAGAAPFTGDNEFALITAQLQTEPPPLLGRVPDLDTATEQALMRALAKRPEERFGSVEEFGKAIGAMALRGESGEILAQLYAHAFPAEDLDGTRITQTAPRSPVDPTMPSNPKEWQPPEPDAQPSVTPSWPSHPMPSFTSHSAAATPAPIPTNRPIAATANSGSRVGRRVIGGCAAALLLLTGGYFGVSLDWGTQALQSASPVGQTQVSQPAPPDRQAAPVTPPLAVPIEKAASDTVAPPPSVTVAAVEPAPQKDAKAEPTAQPVVPIAAAPPMPEPASAGPLAAAAPAAPVAVASGKDNGAPPPAEEVAASPSPKSGQMRAEPPLSQELSPPATRPPSLPPADTIRVASAEPQPAVAPAPLGPQVQPAPAQPGPQVQVAPAQPEGEPDLQGRVGGAKRLDEIEVAGRWIKLYGVVDRARGAQEADHVRALLRYLKPAQNVLVCYRKAGDTYRCYAAGQDIAQLALADGMVQPAPNAPVEYRSSALKKR